MKYLETKIKYLPTITCLIVEMGVSGYYAPIDGFWIFTRIGLIFVFLALVIADQINTIKLLPIVLIGLSIMSIRHQWQTIEKEKIDGMKLDYSTNIKPPEKIISENCELFKKSWAVDNCQTRNFKLSENYTTSLRVYNSRIIKSENKKESVKTELTLYEQQPVWIYVFLTCIMCFLTFKSTPEEEIKVKTNIDYALKEKDERNKIINRIIAGRTNLSISEELGIDRRKIAQVKKEIGHACTVNVQPMYNVVKFEGKKRA